MSEFNALGAMGIRDPGQIARYAVYALERTDIIRIVYDRKRGSLLAVSQKFHFPRIKKSTLVDGGTRRTEMVYESTLEFRNAVAELDRLMAARRSEQDVEAALHHEVTALEEEVAARLGHIRSLLTQRTTKDKK